MSQPKFYMYYQFVVSIPLLLLVSFFFNFAHSQFPPHTCHQHDKKILIRIKHHLGNPPSLASWDQKTDCCDPFHPWNGIRCDRQGHVTLMQIGEADDIHASIPPFLDRLPSLTQLYFYNVPKLYGTIPLYIGKLTNLTTLMIYSTNVTGPIPDILGQLKSLSSLDLSRNRLTGPIPMTLANLTSLDTLNLYSNNLSGPIPDFIGQQLTNLKTIDLSSNSLSGFIPASLGLNHGLVFLSLSENQLTGSVPKSLGPANIGMIKLAHNQLTGDASFLFDKNNTAITYIDLNNNLFEFDFSNVAFAPYLSTFNISHNMIYGSLPKLFYRLLPYMDSSIDVSYNQLCGPIPNGRRLKKVDPIIFSHNKCLCGGPLPACK